MALTKVAGDILDPGIVVSGVVTATAFDGPFRGGSDSDIIAGIVTATGLDINGNGDISGNLVVGGNLTANGDFTTLNTTLREVELLRVDANNDNVAAGIITQTGSGDLLRLYDGTSQVVTVDDQGNVGLGSVTPEVKLDVVGDLTLTSADGGAAAAPTIKLQRDSGSPVNQDLLGQIMFGGKDSQGSDEQYAMVAGKIIQAGAGGEHGAIQITTRKQSQHVITANLTSTDYELLNGTNLSVDGNITGNSNFTLTSTDGGSAAAPELTLFRNSGSPADADYLGQIKFSGKHDAGSTVHYAKITGKILDASNNSEDGILEFAHIRGGTQTITGRWRSDKLQLTNGTGLEVAGISTFSNTIDAKDILINDDRSTTHGFLSIDKPDAGSATLKFKNNGSDHGYIQLTNGEDLHYYLPTSSTTSDHVFYTAGQQRVIMLGTGYVGIGTGNPSALLDVNKGTQANIQIKTTQPGSINSMSFAIGSASNQIYSRGANVSTPRDFIFAQGSTQVVGIDTTGNITLKDTAAQGNSLVHSIKATDVNGNSQYQLGMVSSGNQDLYLIQSKSANLRFQTSGSTRWKISPEGHLLPETAAAVNVGSATTYIGDVYIADEKKIFLGNDQDVQIYHTNHLNASFIKKSGTGNFYFDFDGDFTIRNAAGSTRANFVGPRAQVELYHTAQVRLSTTTTGITVGGEVAATQDYPDFQPVLDLNFMQNSTLDPRVTYTRDGTASYVDETGRLRWVGAHVPRFDHDPITGKSKGLLIEESRTNIFHASASDYLSNIPRSTYNVNANGALIRVSDDVLAPDGSRTTTKLYWDGTYNSGGAWNQNGYARVGAYTGELTAGDYVFSFFVKRGTDGRHNMDPFLGFDGSTPTFGTGHYQGVFQDFSPYFSRQPNINGSDATIQKFPNGWYRCIGTFTADQSWTPDNAGISHYILGASNFKTYYEAMAHYYWGFQLEKAAFATSYIGNSLQEQTTRGADTVMIDGENFTEFYNPVESTIVVNYTHPDAVTSSNLGGSARLYRFRAVGGSDTRIDYVSNTNNEPYIASDGTNVANISNGQSTVFGGGANKTAVRVKEDSFASSFNGSTAAEDTSGAWNPTNTITEVSLGSGTGDNPLNGHIQRFMYYPVGLPNSQLVTLTS